MLNDKEMKSRVPTLAILGYHKIGEPSPGGWNTWFYIPEKTFVEHLTFLRENGWKVINIQTFLQSLIDPEIISDRSVMITFDDGYLSIRRYALPWLRRFDCPAVLFVPTDYIGSQNLFDEGIEPAEDICGWEDLRELQRNGVSVQSHGASHRWFSKLTPHEQERELFLSKEVLEDNLGSAVDVLAFPYGDNGKEHEETAKSLSKAGYHAAFLYGGSPMQLPPVDLYRLPRLTMGPNSDLQKMLKQR
jgi:peptidoglycan/xylan/chitin deacetylase (PgdA/CDA1 family)